MKFFPLTFTAFKKLKLMIVSNSLTVELLDSCSSSVFAVAAISCNNNNDYDDNDDDNSNSINVFRVFKDMSIVYVKHGLITLVHNLQVIMLAR